MRLPLLLLGAVRAGAEAAGDLRLVGGGSAREGRLEIFAADGATWQRVCDDGWDDTDAQVACRQLGMGGGKAYKGPGSAEAVVVHAFDGAPAAAAWPHAAECGGDEEALRTCVNASAAAVTCSNSEHAGLACSSGIVLLVVIATSGAAVVAALLLTCRLAIRHARESAGLDAIKCSDVCHAWCAVVGHLPRACLSLCCGSKSAGSSGSYGRSRRSKASAVSVQQASQLFVFVGMFNILGRISGGKAADYFGTIPTFSFSMCMAGALSALLPASQRYETCRRLDGVGGTPAGPKFVQVRTTP